MNARYGHLLRPGRINRMELKNRIVFSPMGSNLADEGGFCGERLRAYYEERAKGGAALVSMGSVSVGYPLGASNWRQEAISDDKYIPGIRAIADAMHNHGARLSIQLHHAGITAMHDMLAGRPLACPSVPHAAKTSGDFLEVMLDEEQKVFFEPYEKMGEITYAPLTSEQMEEISGMFAAAACRAQEAGADAVELHAGHGYIFSSFLSPAYNQRSDDYGGSVENRARFLTDTIKAVRHAVGPDYPVWMRFDSVEFDMPDGITLADAKVTARLAEEAGLDAIHVSAHGNANYGTTYTKGHATDTPNGFIANASAIKKMVSVPVLCPGRIEPDDAERFIAEGKIDFVVMGRKLLADPHLPNKLKEGRPEDIRPCIYCYTCISNIFASKHVICAVNPVTGHELERQQQAATSPKTVVVAGGGPGGMEAARLLAEKGHKVILCEATERLGGTAQFASVAYKPNERIVRWLKEQVGKAPNIEIRLKTAATPALLATLRPDEVVVATGARRSMPDIPGSGRDFVFSGDDMRSLVLGQNLESLKEKTSWATRAAMKLGAKSGVTASFRALRLGSQFWMPIGKKVVIVGGELVGMELAEFLAERGRQVTVLEEGIHVGRGIQLVRRFRVIADCHKLGVMLNTRSTAVEIGDHTVSYLNSGQQRRTITADTVIIAKGATGDESLADSLKAAGYKVSLVGDCTGVGYIKGAMEDAALAVQNI